MTEINAELEQGGNSAKMKDALARYAAAEVPRYTSYPTAAQFHSVIGESDYRSWLSGIGKDDSLSLYVHVPFCQHLCLYCGCHTTIVHEYDRVARYVRTLHKEIDLLARALPSHGGVTRIHFGGGTPTMLADEDLAGLLEALKSRIGTSDEIEIAVEADPRTLSAESAHSMARAGVTRASLGVQDFSPDVQKLIHRVQPVSTVADACEWLRAAGIDAINFDLMYGLPGQTAENVAETAAQAAAMNPNRIAVFGYAHVPWFKKHQKVLEKAEIPGVTERFKQAGIIAEGLKQEGYREIGFDHYAHPDDPLATAIESRGLRRNFQGYTDDPASVLLGLGASSIGALSEGYVQNTVRIDHYAEGVEAGHLPIAKGVAVSGEDRLRRDAIERLLCDLKLDMGELCAKAGFDPAFFDDALPGLRQLAGDGLVELDGRVITVTPEGRRFLRSVAVLFDAYWQPSEARHSKAV